MHGMIAAVGPGLRAFRSQTHILRIWDEEAEKRG